LSSSLLLCKEEITKSKITRTIISINYKHIYSNTTNTTKSSINTNKIDNSNNSNNNNNLEDNNTIISSYSLDNWKKYRK
jgi:hypothetical protein